MWWQNVWCALQCKCDGKMCDVHCNVNVMAKCVMCIAMWRWWQNVWCALQCKCDGKMCDVHRDVMANVWCALWCALQCDTSTCGQNYSMMPLSNISSNMHYFLSSLNHFSFPVSVRERFSTVRTSSYMCCIYQKVTYYTIPPFYHT